jgi:hypothetical protein
MISEHMSSPGPTERLGTSVDMYARLHYNFFIREPASQLGMYTTARRAKRENGGSGGGSPRKSDDPPAGPLDLSKHQIHSQLGIEAPKIPAEAGLFDDRLPFPCGNRNAAYEQGITSGLGKSSLHVG